MEVAFMWATLWRNLFEVYHLINDPCTSLSIPS